MSLDEAESTAPRDHAVQFYGHDDELVASVGDYLIDGLRAGEAAIVVASSAHRLAFESALVGAGIDVDAARRAGRLVELDADDALDRLMRGDRPDPQAFDAVVGELVRGALHLGPVRAFGEMVALLWDDGLVPAAMELEALWNDLGRDVPFSLYCAYPTDLMAGDDQATAFTGVCHLHSEILGSGSSRSWARHLDDPGDVVSQDFPRGADSPRRARRFVADALNEWGRDELAADAALIVTELAANAVLHARSDFVVTLERRGGTVQLGVRDWGTAIPVPRDALPTAATGRGLRLVAALSRHWGTELPGRGKVVWAELAATPTY